ncbi:MAG: class I SAM-dependent methyltransferase [Oscillospiraceae bacterium]
MSYEAFAECYDLLTENVEYEKRAEYFTSLFSDNGINKGILLDLACGTGSLSLEFSKRGFSVIGTDLSEEMLSVAQNKKYESGQDILFLCQDMRKLDLYGTIDCAISALDSLNHITNEKDLKAVFQKVSLFMNKGGIFIFDVNTLYKHQEVLKNNAFVYDLDEIYCVWQNKLLKDNVTVEISLDLFFQSEDEVYERFSENFSEKAYSVEIIEKIINETGFSLIGKYDELTKNEPKENSERIVFVIKKD